jgi:transposase-like protein
MPLSLSLHSVSMTFECPFCTRTLVKSGGWFQTIGRFKCNGCQREVRLTYSDKVALFDKHAHFKRKISN